MTQELQALAQWLYAAQVTAAAMEATGVYWRSLLSGKDVTSLQIRTTPIDFTNSHKRNAVRNIDVIA